MNLIVNLTVTLKTVTITIAHLVIITIYVLYLYIGIEVNGHFWSSTNFSDVLFPFIGYLEVGTLEAQRVKYGAKLLKDLYPNPNPNTRRIFMTIMYRGITVMKLGVGVGVDVGTVPLLSRRMGSALLTRMAWSLKKPDVSQL